MQNQKYLKGMIISFMNGQPFTIKGEIKDVRFHVLHNNFEYLIQESEVTEESKMLGMGKIWVAENQIKTVYLHGGLEIGEHIAKIDMPIKYTHQLGGGIRLDARTVKAGDKVTVIGTITDIDTVSVTVLELLNRVELSYFKENFKRKVQLIELETEKPFVPGDVIEFCDDNYFVIENYGSSGAVCPFGETYYVNNFFWSFGSDKAKFVRKPTAEELHRLGIVK